MVTCNHIHHSNYILFRSFMSAINSQLVTSRKLDMVLADADIDRIAGAAVEGLQKLMAPLPGGLTQAQHEAIAKGLHAVELPDKASAAVGKELVRAAFQHTQAGMRPAEATALAFEEKGTTPRSGTEVDKQQYQQEVRKIVEGLGPGHGVVA